MLFWLGFVGHGALAGASNSRALLCYMFVFGIALTVGAFFLEAVKAKRLLTAAILNSGSDATNKRWPAEVSNNPDNT